MNKYKFERVEKPSLRAPKGRSNPGFEIASGFAIAMRPKWTFATVSLLIILSYFLAATAVVDALEAQETIFYDIEPIGSSLYQDFGAVDLGGKKLDLVVFKTSVAGFHDTEKIYSDPATYLPLRVERDISILLHQEYLTEEYFPRENRLLITKFEGGKKVREYPFKAKGPIHNAILLPFSLRKIKELKIGWSCQIRLPDEIKVKLVSVDEIAVPAGKFRTYHFTSTPYKFEIWISADKLRLPVKIKGAGGLGYTLKMKKHIAR